MKKETLVEELKERAKDNRTRWQVTQEVADSLGYKRKTIHKWTREGKLMASFHLNSRSLRWDAKVVAEWLRRRCAVEKTPRTD